MGVRRRESEVRRLVVFPLSLSFSRCDRRSLRCFSLAVLRTASSHRMEATELDDERGERPPENVDMPEAVEGGRRDDPLESMDDGRPCALRMRWAESTESRCGA